MAAKQAEVICAGIRYFKKEAVLDSEGEPRKLADNTTVLYVDIPHDAVMAEVVELSEHEFQRLAALGCVQEPGAAPLPNDPNRRPLATPFSAPMRTDEDDEALAYPESSVINNLPPTTVPAIDRAGPGLSPEEAARLVGQIDDDEDGDGVIDPQTASVADLAEWIRTDKPNATEVVEAAQGDSEIAAKLLEAEQLATDPPRKSVVEPLQRVADEEDEAE
jgi:hypothetical protein